jgi:hypothetical protein
VAAQCPRLRASRSAGGACSALAVVIIRTVSLRVMRLPNTPRTAPGLDGRYQAPELDVLCVSLPLRHWQSRRKYSAIWLFLYPSVSAAMVTLGRGGSCMPGSWGLMPAVPARTCGTPGCFPSCSPEGPSGVPPCGRGLRRRSELRGFPSGKPGPEDRALACVQEVKDHFSRSQHASELRKREVFTFGPEQAGCRVIRVPPTG